MDRANFKAGWLVLVTRESLNKKCDHYLAEVIQVKERHTTIRPVETKTRSYKEPLSNRIRKVSNDKIVKVHLEK